MEKITVLLADDHNVVRHGLRFLLESQPDIAVTGEAETGRQAVQLFLELRPDVVVMDIAMPQLNGLEAMRQILKEDPAARVLMLSSYSEEDYVHQAIESGAAGYLLKQAGATDLIRAIREAKNGNAFFSPAIARRLLEKCREAFQRGVPVETRTERLTSRETEVLQLVAEGKVNKEIASELRLSIKTVEKHRQELMIKLNIHDVAGLTRYAIAKGIIENCPTLCPLNNPITEVCRPVAAIIRFQAALSPHSAAPAVNDPGKKIPSSQRARGEERILQRTTPARQ